MQKFIIAFGILLASLTANPLDVLELQPRLFGLQSIGFEKDESSLAIQHEYVFKHLREHPQQYGLLFKNLQNYLQVFSAEETLQNTRSLSHLSLHKKLDELKTEDRLAIRAFFSLYHIEEMATRTADVRDLLQASQNEEYSGWIRLITAILLKELIERDLNSEFEVGQYEQLLKQTSLKPSKDAFLHYSLGLYYDELLRDRKSPYRRMRMVTLELERARSMDPRNRQLFTRITSTYIAMQQEFERRELVLPFEFEELVYRRILLLDPKNPSAHNNLAWLYCQNSTQLKNANRHARIATELAPQVAAFKDTLGMCQYRSGMLEKSLATLQAARQQDDSLADIHFHLATVYYELDQIEDSIAAFQRCIDLDPANALAMNNLAYTLAEQNRELPKALELVQRALARFPQNSAFVDTLGWIQFQLGNTDEALEQLKRAIELSPDSWESHEHLAAVYEKLDENGLAQKHLAQAARLKGLNSASDTAASNPQSEPKPAYKMLFQTILATRNRYLKLPETDKSPQAVKVFYDQLVALAQSHGDQKAVQKLLREFQAYQQSFEPATEEEGKESSNQSASTHDLKALLPSETLAWLEMGQNKLFLVLQRLAQMRPESSHVVLNTLLPNLRHVLPERLGIGVLSSKTQHPGIVIALQATQAQSKMMQKNLAAVSGQSILAPMTGMKVKIQSMTETRYRLQLKDFPLYLEVLPEGLIAATEPRWLKLPGPSQSLLQKPQIQKHLEDINARDKLSFYAANLKQVAHKIQTLPTTVQALGGELVLEMLASMGEYLAIMKLDGDTLHETEFIRSADGISQEDLKSILSGYIGRMPSSNNFEIETELTAHRHEFELNTRLKGFNAFIETIMKSLKKAEQDPQ